VVKVPPTTTLVPSGRSRSRGRPGFVGSSRRVRVDQGRMRRVGGRCRGGHTREQRHAQHEGGPNGRERVQRERACIVLGAPIVQSGQTRYRSLTVAGTHLAAFQQPKQGRYEVWTSQLPGPTGVWSRAVVCAPTAWPAGTTSDWVRQAGGCSAASPGRWGHRPLTGESGVRQLDSAIAGYRQSNARHRLYASAGAPVMVGPRRPAGR
jgi:hypothetical protein